MSTIYNIIPTQNMVLLLLFSLNGCGSFRYKFISFKLPVLSNTSSKTSNMNRTTKHILHDRLVRKLKRDYRILRTSLAMQASFPDSGYFYSKIERKCEWALEKLEIVLRKDKFKKYIDFLEKHCDRLSWEYYEKVQVVDKNGREWTDYEMDAAMAMQ